MFYRQPHNSRGVYNYIGLSSSRDTVRIIMEYESVFGGNLTCNIDIKSEHLCLYNFEICYLQVS